MKVKAGLVVAMGMLFSQTWVLTATAAQLSSDADKLSYAIGANIGADFKAINSPLNADIVAQGIKDSTAGSALLMTQQEINDTLTRFQKQIIAKQQASNKQLGAQNLAEGAKFLAANKSKPGVVALPSGLQYKILVTGKGAKPGPNDVVVVNYEGKTLDGKVFDSSYTRGKPASFSLASIIPGWAEALQLMPVGSKWELYIPSKLAYGATGAEPFIQPNATLIFTVELLDAKPAAATNQ